LRDIVLSPIVLFTALLFIRIFPPLRGYVLLSEHSPAEKAPCIRRPLCGSHLSFPFFPPAMTFFFFTFHFLSRPMPPFGRPFCKTNRHFFLNCPFSFPFRPIQGESPLFPFPPRFFGDRNFFFHSPPPSTPFHSGVGLFQENDPSVPSLVLLFPFYGQSPSFIRQVLFSPLLTPGDPPS